MRAFVTALLGLLTVTAAHAQISVTPRGSASTFDVGAWNLEFFGEPTEGPNDDLQAARVQAVIEGAQIDFWALEEVVNTARFNTLLTGIADNGYAGVLGPDVSTSPVFNQRLAFIYNTSVVQVVSTQSILTSQASSFGGRAPFEMTANITLDGATRQFRLIALHAKATGDVTSYNQRVAGAAALKTYVDGLIAEGRNVLVLGDYNDELTSSITSGRVSPYSAFVADSRYTFATATLDAQNIATYCSNASCTSGSTLDHILIAGAGAQNGYVTGSGDRYGELLTGITQYTQTTSDHLPVLARFSLPAVAGEEAPQASAVALLPAAPSPFRSQTTLRFVLVDASDVQIDVLDILGRTVAHLGGTYGVGTHQISLDGSNLAAGLYRVRLRAAGTEATQTVIRAR